MIELESVTKYFGSFPAITDLSFRVEKGEILGFLGPNGAGKSTTMKIITGFMPPSSGKVTVAGYDIETSSLEARRHIGYLPETVPLYTDMTVEDYLGFMGRIRGLSGAYLRERIEKSIQTSRLEEYQSTHISKLSKGYRQRVGIAQCILHDPDVLVLDEPTIGIDPIQVVETRNLIRGLAGEHTVIVSTHILPEVSEICERVIIIHEGQIVAVDRPENLASRLRGVDWIHIKVRGPRRSVLPALEAVEGVHSVVRTTGEETGISSYQIEARTGGEMTARLATVVAEGGWDLMHLESVDMSLEEIFLRLTTAEEGPQA